MDPGLSGQLHFHEVRGSLSLGLVQVTEAAALAAGRLLGRADGERVKQSAASAMLRELESQGFQGRVVLSPRGDRVLSHGSALGPADAPSLDLAVYPVEGASVVARGLPNAISVLAAADPGTFPQLPAVWYVEKIVVGAEARGAVDLDDSLTDNLRRIAFARDVRVTDLCVAVLDRPRHHEMLEEIRAAGARVLMLEEGEIAGAIMAAAPGTGVDAMVGIGGLQETLIAACAVRCLGGDVQARLWARNDEERLLAGEELERKYGVSDLAPAEVAVAVTGISGGQLVDGVWFGSNYAETHSLSMSTRGATVRRMTTRHHRVGEPG
ncbi:MAG TPA: fructose-bisphosphatase class II [Candidatus Dormibacteraeota bacterium]